MATAKATVLFSGGIDSTLCAALNLERFGQINLLTYQRSKWTGLTRYEKCLYHLPALHARYSPEQITHHYQDYTALFGQLFTDQWESDLRRYGTHLFLLVCMSCKLAMHAQTILYNLRHRISYAADGSFHGQDHSPEQMSPILEAICDLYARFGINFSYPIYDYHDKSAIQAHLYQLGLVSSPVFKQKALSTTDSYLFHKNQPSCYLGIVAGAYSKFYYGPLFGYQRSNENSLNYYQEKLQTTISYIEECQVRENLATLSLPDAPPAYLQPE